MSTGTHPTTTRHRSTAAIAAALLTVGLLGTGCQTTDAVDPAIVGVDDTDVVGAVNIPGGRMLTM